MNVGEFFGWLADAAAKQPVLLLALLLGVGSLAGRIRIRGMGLGPAAVLFTALVFSAADDRLVLPAIVGSLGLALFAYTLGLAAGPSFFASLRSGARAIGATAAVLALAGAAVLAAGEALGLSRGLIAGTYAGALTNTPALAAATEKIGGEDPVVGYSLTYLFGVLGMMVVATVALKSRRSDDAPDAPGLVSRNVRVEEDGLPTFADLVDRYGGRIKFSRIMRGDTPTHPGDVDVALPSDAPEPGDIVTVVGPESAVAEAVTALGHPSTVDLPGDRRTLGVRRIVVSRTDVAGSTIGELELERTYGATATRVRRGDIDLLATDDLRLLPGDRVRIVADDTAMLEVAALFGDSDTAAAGVNAVGLGVGLSLGVLLGLLEWPLPGGAFSLGVAGGSLLMGLMLGRAARTGPITWSLPHGVSATIGQLGMLMFLAYAGSTAGPALVKAFDGDQVWTVIGLGAALNAATGAALWAVGRWFAKLPAPMLAGAVAGGATQPAVLAHANAVSGSAKVNVGYALVYPASMIVKVVVAPLLGTLFL